MQLDQVRTVLARPGPFVSLNLDVSRTTEDARQQIDARWTSIRHELEHNGITGSVVDEIGERLHEPTHLPGEVHRTIVATADEVVLDDARAGTSRFPEGVSVGPLPDLAAWLGMVDGDFPFVLVRADRAGADIEVYVAPGQSVAAERSVDGETMDIRKLPEGDWMQKKYQQRAENNWRANAELVAGQLRDLATRYHPRVAILCGDVRACADIAEIVGDVPRMAVEVVDSGGRAAGVSEEALWADVRRVLAAYEARDTDDLLQTLDRGASVGEDTAHGVDPVIDALVQGGVERLVIDPAAARDLTIDIADHPGLTLPEGANRAGPLPADQVLVAAAAMTDAEVTVVSGGMIDPPVAATLRWAEAGAT
jgi:hypothetical protein